VKDLMVPLSEYATVHDDATLFEAVLSLEKAQAEFDHSRYRHRAILVLNNKNKVIGKISQLDILKALEPKYSEMLNGHGLHHFGFSNNFMKSMLKDYQLFESPLEDICKKAARQDVKNFMYTPSEGEYVDAKATLDIAIHQLIIGSHQSLLVTQGADIIGVIRLTDVFAAIYHTMRECC
jgi:CBS domain-containing protein